MYIAICDDDPETAQAFCHIAAGMHCGFSCDVFSDGQTLAETAAAHPDAYQIYVLDIEVPRLNGIQAAASIRQRDPYAVFIFVTGYPDRVYEVFETLPFRFLRKPVDADALACALRDAQTYLRRNGLMLFFRIGREQHQLPCREIAYLESAARKVRIYTLQGSVFEIYGRLSALRGQLDAGLFAQTHASYLVNMEAIRSIQQDTVVLAGGIRLPVSRRFRQALKQRHLSFIATRC